MSETTEQPASEAAPEPPVIETEVPAAEMSPEGGEPQVEAPVEPTEETPPAKPNRAERHIAHLTAAKSDADRRAEAAERRAEAAEALLRVNRQGDDETPPHQPRQPVQDVDAQVEQRIREREFNARLSEIDAKGKAEVGADVWEQAKATLTSLGAATNQNFLQALAKSKAPERVFAALADDTDKLMDILNETPAGMGAIMGEMGAELTRPVLAAKPTSNAPRPPAPVHTSSAPVQPSLEQLAKGSVDDYVAQLKKEFPNSKLFAGIR